jgi:hypothetical protein
MKTKLAALGLCLAASFAARANVAINGPLTHEHVVEPGRSYAGSIEVQNQAETPQAIRVYQTDYFFYADGSAHYGEPGKLQRSNAGWITFTPKDVTVPPRDSVSIHYTIQAPSDDTMLGTYWSILMVEPVDPGSPEAVGSDPSVVRLGVRQVLRYGIQIVTHVGTTGSRLLRFSQFRLTAENGRKVLVVDLENGGERWLRPTLWVDLYDEKGTFVGKFDGGAQRLYPGTSARFRAELVGVQDAAYKALVVADCGGDDVFGANVNLNLRE